MAFMLSLCKKTNVYGGHPHPHQLFHLAACADEQFLVESQGCVDCSGIQLELSSFCARFNTSETNFQHNELTTDGRKSMNMTQAGMETALITLNALFRTVLHERAIWMKYISARKMSLTSCRVHFNQDVIAARFDNCWHDILHRCVHWEHESERLVVWSVDLVQHCTEEGDTKCQDMLILTIDDVGNDVCVMCYS